MLTSQLVEMYGYKEFKDGSAHLWLSQHPYDPGGSICLPCKWWEQETIKSGLDYPPEFIFFFTAPIHKRKKFRRMKSFGTCVGTQYTATDSYNKIMISLDDCSNKPCITSTAAPTLVCAQKEEKGTTMATFNTTADLTAQQKNYLASRLDTLKWQKADELRAPYGLKDDDAPQSFDELLERLDKGRYVISDEKRKLKYGWYDAMCYVEWRDPAIKKDREGYDAAVEKVEAAALKVKDIIVVKSLDDGLAAVEAFETAAFQ